MVKIANLASSIVIKCAICNFMDKVKSRIAFLLLGFEDITQLPITIASSNLLTYSNISASVDVSILSFSTAAIPKRLIDQLILDTDKALYAAKTSEWNWVVHGMHISD